MTIRIRFFFRVWSTNFSRLKQDKTGRILPGIHAIYIILFLNFFIIYALLYMVYVLDGCSFHHAHIQNKQIFKNLPKHMLTLKKTSNQSFLGKKFPFTSCKCTYACATCSGRPSHIRTMSLFLKRPGRAGQFAPPLE